MVTMKMFIFPQPPPGATAEDTRSNNYNNYPWLDCAECVFNGVEANVYLVHLPVT